ncbi:acyl-CoA dehydratase activase-related protein [Adlercreutzia faecimuris]|uniref:Acyl-CoA dehydratase activase-related protein n=1 Tax=Adlercreutzia faecimuris TaxID=2897341 RepID=A0ABS9WEA0_9ACTN|nr:acyl-CoA dehydratase activase-related protein [Adlercreutzia sp. JBNU-10]MCI2241195.1 acyl-CoA dehydratase activase-related protein [Adlercreutzia sp. JBNU-10]
MALKTQPDLADIHVVGIPRGLLYHRYGPLWETFFRELGREVIVSAETDRAVVEEGTARSVDECCLASKAYLGHVASLVGRCDAVFVPCYASCDPRAGFCTKFQAAPDLVANTFRDQGVRVLSCLVENVSKPKEVRRAFAEMAARLGASQVLFKRAWKAGVRALEDARRAKAAAQEETLRLLAEYRAVAEGDPTGATERPLAILLVAHPYIAHDEYLCGTIVEALESMGTTVLFADETNRARTYKASFGFTETLPWVINRELIGSILTLQDQVDGIVLVSAFPCGPDSMTDDTIMRYIQGTPILNLMIDAQSGTAGVETRIESFVDILRYHQRGGYVHG